MSYSLGITTNVITRLGDRAIHNNGFNSIFRDHGENTNQPPQGIEHSLEQRARRVYGTSEQQAIKAGKITGSNVLIEPFTSCLVASDQRP